MENTKRNLTKIQLRQFKVPKKLKKTASGNIKDPSSTPTRSDLSAVDDEVSGDSGSNRRLHCRSVHLHPSLLLCHCDLIRVFGQRLTYEEDSGVDWLGIFGCEIYSEGAISVVLQPCRYILVVAFRFQVERRCS